MDPSDLAPYLGMAALFAVVVAGALFLVPPFSEAGLQATETPEDPANTAIYVVAVLVITALIIAAMRYEVDFLVKAGVLFSVGVLAFYVLDAFLPSVAGGVIAVALVGLLYLHPEWYVVDAAGVLMGAGAAAIFGVSLGVLPAFLLLALLAIYDAVAVYRTKHMLTLADGVMEMRLPVLFVVPRRRGYSFMEDVSVEEDDRDALYMGLGDAVIPTVLAASALSFAGEMHDVAGVELYTAGGAVAGIAAGFGGLMYLVSKGKPHAGLPLLNAGAVLGFFAGALYVGVTPLQALGLG